VTLPVARFERPGVTLDGKKAAAVVRVQSGQHRFVVAGKLITAATL